jgi:hypothetical protein
MITAMRSSLGFINLFSFLTTSILGDFETVLVKGIVLSEDKVLVCGIEVIVCGLITFCGTFGVDIIGANGIIGGPE